MSEVYQSVTVANRLEELAQLYEALEAFADRAHLPQPTRRALLLVVEELFTNVIHHGYDPGAVDSIGLSMRLDAGLVQLTFRDSGRPFDAGGTPNHPDEELTLDQMPVGGLGLFLVHEFAQSVESRRDGAVNVTEVRLPVGDDAGALPPA